MTKKQRDRFYDLCVEYRCQRSMQANQTYIVLLDYVETLIDEAVKGAINAQNSDKME